MCDFAQFSLFKQKSLKVIIDRKSVSREVKPGSDFCKRSDYKEAHGKSRVGDCESRVNRDNVICV